MKRNLGLGICAAMAIGGTAAAQDTYYLKGSLGIVMSADSTNSGRTTEAFEPGLIDAVLVEGGAYRFRTDFEPGGMALLALGKESRFGPFRSELEFSYTAAQAKDHQDFQTLGANLDAADVAVLLGFDAPVGINIGEALGDAQGDISTATVMVNFLADLGWFEGTTRPYGGVGIGASRVMVDYSPSGIGLVDDGATVFAWQLMAGIDHDLSERNTLYAGFRYRGAMEAEVETDALLASELKVDTSQVITEFGWRTRF